MSDNDIIDALKTYNDIIFLNYVENSRGLKMSIKEDVNDADLNEGFKSYVDRIYPGDPEVTYQKQTNAFNEMKAAIVTEENPFIKDFMKETVLWLCNQDMAFTYFLEQCWEGAVQEQREAFDNLESLDVFYLLERILASSSSSYGYTKNESYSRYRLNIPGYHEGAEKKRYVVNGHFAPSRILRSYYKFGVHTFYAGRAVKQILEHLEERYGLNFKDLEKNLEKKT